jgi:MFS family permease
MPRLLAAAVVFLTSSAVLVLEILAGRLLAPYIGVTLQTYTGVIGTVLAGIAIGSWAGGRLADRVDPRRVLGPTVVLGGVFALASSPIVRVMGPALGSRSPLSIVTLAALGFFVPALVLTAVTPMVVKLQLDDLAETGQTVGRLSAIGTIGALAGTFFTGFVLVAAFPSQPVVLGTGGALVSLGLWLTLRVGPRGRDRPMVTTPLLGAALVAGALGTVLDVPCEVETAYFCSRVIEDPARPSGRLLILDTLRHSYVDLGDPTHLEFSYAQALAGLVDTFRQPGEAIDALHIGGGGFTLPRYLGATRPGTESLVLELDPTLVDVARNQLGLETGDDLRIRTGDARLGITELDDDAYDLVIGDAFGGLAVPWHLTTIEFANEVRRVLTGDGVYAVNLIDHPPLGFARAETATLQASFAHVAVIAPSERLDGEDGGNFVLLASEAPLDLPAVRATLAERGVDQGVASENRLETFVGDAEVLTDDYAPVDQLLNPR